MNMVNWNPLKEMESLLDRYHRRLARNIDDDDTAVSLAERAPVVDINAIGIKVR